MLAQTTEYLDSFDYSEIIRVYEDTIGDNDKLIPLHNYIWKKLSGSKYDDSLQDYITIRSKREQVICDNLQTISKQDEFICFEDIYKTHLKKLNTNTSINL